MPQDAKVTIYNKDHAVICQKTYIGTYNQMNLWLYYFTIRTQNLSEDANARKKHEFSILESMLQKGDDLALL